LPQNEEQLNNLLKTLDGYYSNEDLRRRCPAAARHQGEFLGYFLLMQLGNGGEVAKFLQQLAGQPALASTDVQFAVQVTPHRRRCSRVAVYRRRKVSPV